MPKKVKSGTTTQIDLKVWHNHTIVSSSVAAKFHPPTPTSSEGQIFRCRIHIIYYI